jgi:hypothetical protein
VTQNVNPNSRAAFTGSDGRLTKYGMDILAEIFRTLGILSSNNLADVQNQLGDLAFLPGILSKNTDMASRIASIEMQTDFAVLASHISAIGTKIDAMQAQMPETAFFIAKIQKLEEQVAHLELDAAPTIPIHPILQRLDAIEAQI